MPLIKRTAYVRPEDIDAWDSLSNRAEWIHNQLGRPDVVIGTNAKLVINAVANPGSLAFCPHNHPMAADGRSCLGKKCKYAQ